MLPPLLSTESGGDVCDAQALTVHFVMDMASKSIAAVLAGTNIR